MVKLIDWSGYEATPGHSTTGLMGSALPTFSGNSGLLGDVYTTSEFTTPSVNVSYSRPGVRFVGESFGNDRNSFKNDARAFVDAALHYDVQAVEGLRVQVNATNIFDEDAALCTEGFCYAEQERQVIGSVRYRF